MKKIFTYVMSAIILLSCVFIFFGCQKPIHEEGYFRYKIFESKEKVKTIEICGLTELGNQQKVLIVPEEIDGIKVVALKNRGLMWGVRGEWESENLEKVFLPYNMEIYNETFKNCKNLRKIIMIDFGPYEKLSSASIITYLESNVNCYIADIIYNLKDDRDLYIREWSKNLKPANIAFLYNYEDSDNYGIYWIDDIDYGSKIEIIPKEPVREGYIFDGWYKEEECITKWDFDADTSPEEQKDEKDKVIYQETKLYAKWIKN